jgi:hypothetical protein
MKSEKFATALAHQQAVNSCGSKFFIFHFYLFIYFRTFAK